jgi:hypothetical protein
MFDWLVRSASTWKGTRCSVADSQINRDVLLNGLSEIARLVSDKPMGKAEMLSDDVLLSMTLPIPAHLNALDPDILLIIGGRGAGKSHLFRLINLPDGPQILGYKGRASNALWLPGFSTRSLPERAVVFPGETALQRFAENRSRTDLMDFWRGLLAGCILCAQDTEASRLLRQALPDSLSKTLSDLGRVSGWHLEVVRHLEDVDDALNRLDDTLTRQGRYLFATYDDLDVMAVEWNEKRVLIQALLQFWLGQWRRWQRIRPKIFLRRDLFAAEFLNFPDASKLTGHKFDLVWTPSQLYQLVFKLWANRGEPCRVYLETAGLRFEQHPHLGWMYTSPWPGEDALRLVVQQMMGKFMGAGPSKGRTFEWPPNHLQDANREIVPRSMLNLFALAAEYDEKNRPSAENLLLSPASFAVAIKGVSELRIKELVEEYPWLTALREPLEGQQVPMMREQLLQLLRGINWQGIEHRPPSTDPDKLLEHLLELGILRRTEDQRIHVPDIYLYGFNLKRKGGIRRLRGTISIG